MPLYNYQCNACQRQAEAIKGAPLTQEELPEVIFETSHAMNPQPAELERARRCPRCDGADTSRTLLGVELTCYVRGYGYLDKRGCHRDMNLYKLNHDDPYAGMRVPGEAEDLRCRLRKSGKRDPKTKHYLTASSAPAAE